MAKSDQIKRLRNNLTLDFSQGPSQKKQKFKYETCIIETPDLNKIALSTPELDKLAMAYHRNAEPLHTFTRNDDEDKFKSLIDPWTTHLAKINAAIKEEPSHDSEILLSDHNKLNDDDTTTTNMIQEPINMKDQERIKLERKRMRNRIAASKCRQRKLERISKLEKKVYLLKSQKSELQVCITAVCDTIEKIRNHISQHRKLGCEIGTID